MSSPTTKISTSNPLGIIQLLQDVQKQAENMQCGQYFGPNVDLQDPQNLQQIRTDLGQRADDYHLFKLSPAGTAYVEEVQRIKEENAALEEGEERQPLPALPANIKPLTKEEKDYAADVDGRLTRLKKDWDVAAERMGQLKAWLEERLDPSWDTYMGELIQDLQMAVVIKLPRMLKVLGQHGLGNPTDVRQQLKMEITRLPVANTVGEVGQLITNLMEIYQLMQIHYEAVTTSVDLAKMARAVLPVGGAAQQIVYKECAPLPTSGEKLEIFRSKLGTSAELGVINNQLYSLADLKGRGYDDIIIRLKTITDRQPMSTSDSLSGRKRSGEEQAEQQNQRSRQQRHFQQPYNMAAAAVPVVQMVQQRPVKSYRMGASEEYQRNMQWPYWGRDPNLSYNTEGQIEYKEEVTAAAATAGEAAGAAAAPLQPLPQNQWRAADPFQYPVMGPGGPVYGAFVPRPPRPPASDSRPCNSFASSGTCSYGTACVFQHGPNDPRAALYARK